MKRMAFAVIALVGWAVGPARADTLPLIEGLPATYTPGQPFTFILRVPELPDFTSYNLEVVFTTEVNDPALIVFPTVAGADRYVYPTSDNFGFQFLAPPGSPEVRLTISDAIGLPGVITIPGQNDTLATVTVSPGAELTGSITLSIGLGTDFEYNTELMTYEPPANIPPVLQGGPPEPVPAPPGVLLLGLGGLLIGLRARTTRRGI